MQPWIAKSLYAGYPALVLYAGNYEAILLPSLGGHLIALRDTARGFHFLHEPIAMFEGSVDRAQSESMVAYFEQPFAYGIPVLFPPNRFQDGWFQFADRTYQLPINEPETHNHIHGFFYNQPWSVLETGIREEHAYAILRQQVDTHHSVYKYFPHTFTLTLQYELSAAGLQQQVDVWNQDHTSMPLMLGFHTAFQVPFSPHSQPEDCRIAINIGEKWELTDRKLPSGRKQKWDEMEENLARAGGVYPFAHPLDAHYNATTGPGPNRAVLKDLRAEAEFVYETDPQYTTWMLWNKDAKSNFFCPEPMSCVVNAPNLNLPDTVTGLVSLAPGEHWSAVSRMYVQPLSLHGSVEPISEQPTLA
ncbi:aldose 1-epimerase [Alicyclobacillaceae bacterium I2511]|nr:aldose 1-epimerase [Alicyclobacillaceae bacterium I2511]